MDEVNIYGGGCRFDLLFQASIVSIIYLCRAWCSTPGLLFTRKFLLGSRLSFCLFLIDLSGTYHTKFCLLLISIHYTFPCNIHTLIYYYCIRHSSHCSVVPFCSVLFQLLRPFVYLSPSSSVVLRRTWTSAGGLFRNSSYVICNYLADASRLLRWWVPKSPCMRLWVPKILLLLKSESLPTKKVETPEHAAKGYVLIGCMNCIHSDTIWASSTATWYDIRKDIWIHSERYHW